MTEGQPAAVDILDRTFDLDAHEMAPMHFWGELFGEPGAKIAELTEPLTKRAAESASSTQPAGCGARC